MVLCAQSVAPDASRSEWGLKINDWIHGRIPLSYYHDNMNFIHNFNKINFMHIRHGAKKCKQISSLHEISTFRLVILSNLNSWQFGSDLIPSHSNILHDILSVFNIELNLKLINQKWNIFSFNFFINVNNNQHLVSYEIERELSWAQQNDLRDTRYRTANQKRGSGQGWVRPK